MLDLKISNLLLVTLIGNLPSYREMLNQLLIRFSMCFTSLFCVTRLCVFITIFIFLPGFSKEVKEILFLEKKAHATFKSAANISDYFIFTLLQHALNVSPKNVCTVPKHPLS